MSSRTKTAAFVSVVMLFMLSSVSANALGSVVWNDCFTTYSGGSVYLNSTSTTVAWTARDGGICGYVAASVRFKEAAPTTANRVEGNGTYIEVSRSGGLGGWHWSRKSAHKHT